MSEMVLHEGVYYTPDDLKAKLAREDAAAQRQRVVEAGEAIAESGGVGELAGRVTALEAELRDLHEQFEKLAASVGESAVSGEKSEGDTHTPGTETSAASAAAAEAEKPKAARPRSKKEGDA